MKTSARGFSAVEASIVILVLLVVAGGGFMLYHRKHTPGGGRVDTLQTVHAQPGTTGELDQIENGDEQSESNINTTYTKDDQSDASSTDKAAADIGGAYDESSL